MKKITRGNYTKDKLYPKVRDAVKSILERQDVISTIDVFMQLQRLSREQYEDWRFGRIAYLERALVGNLSQLNRILRILDCCAQDNGLKPSQTKYCKWGKRGKGIVLQFSKSGHPNLEAAYSRCYVRHGGQEKDAVARKVAEAPLDSKSGSASAEVV